MTTAKRKRGLHYDDDDNGTTVDECARIPGRQPTTPEKRKRADDTDANRGADISGRKIPGLDVLAAAEAGNQSHTGIHSPNSMANNDAVVAGRMFVIPNQLDSGFNFHDQSSARKLMESWSSL